MYALILAGGKGERLRPLTDSMPKPLAPLNGRPILWYQVEWLKRIGVTNVIFLVGYRWEMVRQYFGDGTNFGIKAIYSVETSPLGRGGALRVGMANVPEDEDTVIVLNGDIITSQDP
ncbi:MAG: nucleotidyltransferase family protein, partial [Chloroflexi bacterium]|nr:nucleotidyltransferase family protein [Chloroflexota bacterium]